LGAGHIEGVIDQGLGSLDEAVGFGQSGVDFEGGFVDPAGVDPEQTRIAD
jgi:hypothetical protein